MYFWKILNQLLKEQNKPIKELKCIIKNNLKEKKKRKKLAENEEQDDRLKPNNINNNIRCKYFKWSN